MPRVSAEHLAARRQQILDAARRCFVTDGFHATSMQQVIAEAGLSVGAVYRYFPSKSDLILGIAEQLAEGITGQLRSIADAQERSLVDVMESAIGVVDANTGPDGALPMAVQVWAEAQRDPVLRDLAQRIYGQIVEVYVRIAGRAAARGELPAGADPAAVGPALAALVVGYGLLKLLTGTVELDTYRAGVRAILDSPPTGDFTLDP
ncbi:TetR/AcrR family transcriptional regulator [Virgisporangium ochraceum]|uniref:TetR/AcrR family transcriptional regulator n=1 Tax=Virgisporangium ochraceum TaxID=65505 RepID=UPI0019425566|nr:TetR/AcrR family transcriptional regulator [Virgisporangium ochraceum]